MSILGKVVGVFAGARSKIFMGVIATLLVLGSLLYWRFDSVSESLTLANKEIEGIALELITSEQSLHTLKGDYQLTERLLVSKQDEAIKNLRLANSLEDQLNKEKINNEDLKKCLPVSMHDYTNRVRQFDSYKDSDTGGSGNPE